MQADIPFLLMVRRAAADTFNVIHSPVSGMKNFFSCRFGLNLRFVLRFENDTLFPTTLPLPVKSQIRYIIFSLLIRVGKSNQLYDISKTNLQFLNNRFDYCQ